MEKYKFQAKSEEGLLDKALQELNLKSDEVVTKTYEEKGGLFSGKKYTIEVAKLSDIAEVGKELLKELLESIGIDANVETKLRDGQIKFEIFSKSNSVLIGKKGHILDSIQVYLRQAIYNAIDLFVNVSVDVEGYKQKQIYFLEKKVKKIARDVTLSKVEVKLEPKSEIEEAREVIEKRINSEKKEKDHKEV